ncbi:hypothetical protein HY570_04475, partial [Candidatus Micrarchaeota archaeon]|nr:hypothetical protein [Candidatus Micrarchaeota archaeon]
DKNPGKSIIKNQDYEELCKKEFKDRLEIGIVNRFLYEIGGNFGFKLFTKDAKKSNNFKNYLRQWYSATWPKRAILPLIKSIIGHRSNCLHGDNCSWCWPKRS